MCNHIDHKDNENLHELTICLVTRNIFIAFTIDDNTAMGINTVDPKVVLGREVFPTGHAEELIHVE